MKFLKIQHFTVDRRLPRMYAIRVHAALLDGKAGTQSSKLGRLVLIAAMVATPVAALGQGTGAPPTDLHRYPLPTYEEDWRALQGADRTDVWDPVKVVPLSADGRTSLSLGGEARVTYERFGNQNFGLTAPDPDGYLLQRYVCTPRCAPDRGCASGPNSTRASRAAAWADRGR